MQGHARRALTLAVALALGSTAYAADLMSVYQEAKKYDATFAAAQSALQAGQEKAVQGRSLWLPKLDLNAGVSHTHMDDPDPMKVGKTKKVNSAQYGLSATQPLYNAEASVGKKQLEEQANLAEVSFAAAKQELILRVAQAYFDVLYADDSLEYVRAQKEAVSQQLAQAKKSFEVGVATITDTHEAQAKYDLIIASEIAALNEQAVKRNAFVQLTGVPADNLSPLLGKITATPPQPDEINHWVAHAEQKGLAIAAQRGQLAIAEAQIDKYRLLRQPTLGLSAKLSDDHTRSSGQRSNGGPTSSISLGLNIPLYTGGMTSSRLRESIAERDKSQFELEATRRSTAQTTKQAYFGVKAGAAQIRALDQALVSAQSSLDSTKLGREVGVRTTLDLLNVQQAYFSTKRDLAQARYAYLLNKLRLAQAIGELSESDLESVNTQLSK